jgi:hypothetical protein
MTDARQQPSWAGMGPEAFEEAAPGELFPVTRIRRLPPAPQVPGQQALWPCCPHCDHGPGFRHDGPCIVCDEDGPAGARTESSSL